jgi:hypothetical protein
LRRVGSNESTTADVGLSVEPRFQNHGFGSQLALRIVVMAQTRGVAKLTLLFAAGNWRMRRIAQKLGVRMGFAGGQIEGELVIRANSQRLFGIRRETSRPRSPNRVLKSERQADPGSLDIKWVDGLKGFVSKHEEDCDDNET